MKPCEALYGLLSERGKKIAEFWDVAFPKHRKEMAYAAAGICLLALVSVSILQNRVLFWSAAYTILV